MTNDSREQLRAVKGMNDLFEDDLVTWRHLESTARDVFAAYGFDEIRTPIVEPLDLFVRGVGESSDIVGKEMFVLGGRDVGLALRPENTAGVVRAMIENGKLPADSYQKVAYLGPQFRNERPQAGRTRQFHQLGCEVFGYPDAAADVEVIALVHTLLDRLGIGGDVKLLVSSLGDGGAERAKYNDELRAYFAAHQASLSEDSQRRLATNPLRILDSKDAGDQKLVEQAPKPLDFLSDAARAHFDDVKRGLDDVGIAYTVEPKLVRGLDYYTRTVFEFIGERGVGAQSAVAAGGRYDGLVAELGGRPTPAVGFAAGLERLVLVMKAATPAVVRVTPDIALVAADDAGRAFCRKLAFALRRGGTRAAVDLRGASMKAQVKAADRSGTRFTIGIGSREIAEGKGELKRMADGTVQPVALDAAALLAALRSP